MTTRPIDTDRIDDLHEIRKEVRVICLALMSEDAYDYLDAVGDTLSGIANRLDKLCVAIDPPGGEVGGRTEA